LPEAPTTAAQAAVLDGEAARKAANPPPKSADTVTVCCKLPNGLVLRTYTMEPWVDMLVGGVAKETKIARRTEEEYVLNGYAIKFDDLRRGHVPEHGIVGGYGLTTGVPKDFWERWVKQNEKNPLVTNELVFAHGDELSARSKAKENSGIRSGLEAIDPEKPYLTAPGMGNVRQGTRDAGGDE
jgi:hypothetical protein